MPQFLAMVKGLSGEQITGNGARNSKSQGVGQTPSFPQGEASPGSPTDTSENLKKVHSFYENLNNIYCGRCRTLCHPCVLVPPIHPKKVSK